MFSSLFYFPVVLSLLMYALYASACSMSTIICVICMHLLLLQEIDNTVKIGKTLKKYINIRINKDTHKKLKILAAQLEMSIIELVEVLYENNKKKVQKDLFI